MALIASVGLVPTGSNGGTTSAINTTGATLLVAALAYGIPSPPHPPAQISDSNGNTWTALTPEPSGILSLTMFYVLSATVGSGHTFSTNSRYSSLCVAAFSNIIAFQGTSGNIAPLNPPGIGSAVRPGPITATGVSLAVTGLKHNDVSGTLPGPPASIDSSYIILPGCNVVAVPGINFGSALAYLELPLGGGTNPTWTISSNAYPGATIAIFGPPITRWGISIMLGTFSGITPPDIDLGAIQL